MPDVKITGLTANGVALDGTELFEIVNAAGDSRKELLSDITTFVLDGAVVGVTSTGTKINGLSVTVDSKDANNPVLDLSGTLGSIDLTKQVTGALPIANGGTAATKADAAFDALAPTTTEGDIILRGASSNGRLAIGTKDYVLTSTGTTAAWAAATGGGTPGGSDTQVQFNDGGVFGGDSGLTFDKTNNALTVGGATVTTSNPVINATQTWNAGAVTFTGISLNVTNTASAAASMLMNLQLGGTGVFQVTRGGTATFSKWEPLIGLTGFGLQYGAAISPTGNGFSSTGTARWVLGMSAAFFDLAADTYVGWQSSATMSNGNTVDTRLTRVAAGIVGVRAGSSTAGAALGMVEQTAPSAPSANGCYIYAQDNGAGKTQLMALFNSGAAQQIAIEP